jgi:hypothetical protein
MTERKIYGGLMLIMDGGFDMFTAVDATELEHPLTLATKEKVAVLESVAVV